MDGMGGWIHHPPSDVHTFSHPSSMHSSPSSEIDQPGRQHGQIKQRLGRLKEAAAAAHAWIKADGWLIDGLIDFCLVC